MKKVPSSGRALVSVGSGQQLATFAAQIRFIGRIQRQALKCDLSGTAEALLDFVDTDSMTDHNGNANVFLFATLSYS